MLFLSVPVFICIDMVRQGQPLELASQDVAGADAVQVGYLCYGIGTLYEIYCLHLAYLCTIYPSILYVSVLLSYPSLSLCLCLGYLCYLIFYLIFTLSAYAYDGCVCVCLYDS